MYVFNLTLEYSCHYSVLYLETYYLLKYASIILNKLLCRYIIRLNKANYWRCKSYVLFYRNQLQKPCWWIFSFIHILFNNVFRLYHSLRLKKCIYVQKRDRTHPGLRFWNSQDLRNPPQRAQLTSPEQIYFLVEPPPVEREVARETPNKMRTTYVVK